MTSINDTRARAVADLAEGLILASVDVAAAPERVFQALASKEITEWWVRPGVFDTREWTGDVRAGGRWRASGMTRGEPYVQEGEFLEVESPRWLVHTWERAGKPGVVSTVTYLVEPIDGRTHVTLRHLGFASRDMCSAFAIGLETSLERLAEILAPDSVQLLTLHGDTIAAMTSFVMPPLASVFGLPAVLHAVSDNP